MVGNYKWRYFALMLNILNGDAVIPISLIFISNGIVVPPLGLVKLIVARKDRFCSGTISGASSVTLAPEKEAGLRVYTWKTFR